MCVSNHFLNLDKILVHFTDTSVVSNYSRYIFRLRDTHLVAEVIVSLSTLFITQIHVCVLIMAVSPAPRTRGSCRETARAMPSTSPASPGKHYRVLPLFITLAPWSLSSANEEGRTVFLQHYRTIALHSLAFYLSAVMSNIFTQTLLKMPPIARITEAESDSTALLFSTHWLLHAITAFRTFLSLYAGDFVTNCPFLPLSFIFCFFCPSLSLYLFFHTLFLLFDFILTQMCDVRAVISLILVCQVNSSVYQAQLLFFST